ncbi:MAG: hypothetical protein MH137_12555 [Flavobacteriales bacterium]|nr:hypothetical protein [Flavobacteriales bacterium]
MKTPARLFLLILLHVLFGANLFSQPVLVKSSTYPQALSIDADPLGNYYIRTGNSIFKYNLSDTLFSRFSELQNGTITCLDVSNPMKILLYYADVSKIVFLDNTLNPTFTSTDLYELELETATLACSSYDNGFWVFDAPSFSLTRINAFGEIDRKVKNINQLVRTQISPTYLLEKENEVYLYDPAHGIFVFDIFGGFLKLWPLKGFLKFSVVQKNFFYVRYNKVYKYDTRNFTETYTALPQENVKEAVAQKDRLYLLTHNGQFFVYKLN